MFKQDRREIFSFRKFKDGRTDSALIGATILALGLGLVTTTQTVSADVVNGAGGSEVALVDSVDKTTSANKNTFTDDTDSSKVLKVDAVLNKGVAEPTKANENKGEADGTDTVTVTSETTVNYKLEEDKSLLKTETVATGQGTIKTPYDKKGLAADTDGKDYRESTADKSGITVSEETGKQDTLELNGKVYERTRSEVEGADKAKYSKTQFNDIEASVSPEGMHNKLGEINYSKTNGKVYLVEETADGQYGKFVETNGVSSDEDAVSKWKAGLASAKDFTKANVTLQEGDSILVLDKDTYAVGSSKTVTTKKRFGGITFGFAENTVDVDRNTSFDNPTYALSQSDSGESANILEAGPDGIFGTSDDVRKTVDKHELFDFDDGGDLLRESIKEDLKPFFDYKDYVPLEPTDNPTLATALKKHKMYERIYQILDFAQNEATSPEDKSKVAATKAKLDNYLDGVSTKLADKGVKLVYLPETLPSGTVKKGYYFTGGDAFITSQEASDLISPNGSGVSSTFKGLTFSNFKETTTKSDSVEVVTSVRKEYTLNGDAGFNVVTTTTKKSTYLTEKDAILAMYREGEDKTVKSDFSELVKSGNVKVNDDGSVTVTTTETAPTTKFYKGDPENASEADDSAKEVQPPSDGVFRLSLEEKEREGILGFRAVSETSHNETTYNKHEVITPVRAYKVVADGTSTVTHYYRVKKAPLNVNYYLENTTTSLAPSENQADLPVKSDYKTQAKTIEPKTEVQDLPEKTVTTVTTYELVSTPDNANGKITEGGTTVNYFYRAVVKTTEVAKQAPVTANYYLEGTTDKLAPSDEQGQKDIGSAYTTETKTIAPKVEVQDLEDRVVTKTTTYELVSEPTDKNGNVPVGGKVVNYFYRAVVKEDVVKKQAPVVVNYYKEGTTDKLADSVDQGQKDIGSDYTTEAKAIPDKVDVQDLDDRVITKTTSYELVAEPTDKEGTVPVGGKVVNYYYREVVKEDVVKKQAPVTVNYYKEGTTDKLADSVDQGQKDIGSDYTTEAKAIPDKVEVQDLDDRVITKTTSYELVAEPTDKEGKVPVGGKVVNYYYREVVKEDVVKKQAPVTVNYYKEGTTDKLADSVNQGQKDIGSDYTTEAKVIEPKVEVVDTPEKTVTTTTTYTLKEVPADKDGQVPVGGKVVNYYYVENVDVKEVKKQAPVTVNYYKEGTTDKLVPSVDKGQADIGSSYTTEPAVIEPKVETKEFDDKTVTTTTSYELVKVPEDKDGVVPVGGKVVNYYYREVVKEDVVKKQAPVTVNYYKEGTTDKLADSVDQGQKDIGSDYTTEAKAIPDKVEVQDLDDRVITKTTSYELVAEPTDKNGNVPVGGKVVNYYYREVVKEDVVKKQAPVTVNYYKEGTTDKLADSVDQGQKDIGSDYTTEAKAIPDKVEVQDLDDRVITKTTSYELVAEPTDKEGTVPVGGKVVNYYYREVVKEDVVKKQAPVTVNYYKEGTTDKLVPSVDKGQADIGSSYTTEPAVIEPKVETKEFDDKTVTTTTSYELVKVPEDKDGVVPVGGKVVNYYYREVKKEDVVKKQAPVVVNYYKEGTTDKLADSVDQGQKDIGSDYTTEAKVIKPKVETKEFDDKTVTTTTTYELVAEPTDKEGTVPVGGKVVNYYYREVVKEDVVKKQAPVVVNYYKEGTTDKLADSVNQGQKDIGSSYTTEPAVIEPKVETKEFDDKTVTTTTSYELVKVPEDKDGVVPVGGKVVNYYYREVVKEVAKPNEAPKVEIPEFNGGVVPLDPPVVDIPELKIPEEFKPEPKPAPTPQPAPAPQPEPKPAPTPQPAPAPQPEPKPAPTPQPAPAPQPVPQPEPSPAPNPVPVTPETPEQPAEPATPQYMDGQRELPNTGTEANSSLAALGLLGVLSGFGLIARRKRKDEE